MKYSNNMFENKNKKWCLMILLKYLPNVGKINGIDGDIFAKLRRLDC